MQWNYNFATTSSFLFVLLSYSAFLAHATNSNRATTTMDPPIINEKRCRVNNFLVQKNFNSSLYQGHWFVASWNKHSLEVEHPILSKIVSFRNVEAFYTLHKDGNYRFLGGNMVFRMFCHQDETIAYVTNKTAPQKLMVQVQPNVKYPHWIIQTDYTGYSVVYSCLKVLPNGMCAPGHTIIKTLNRKPNGHTPSQKGKIDSIVRKLCVDPSELKIVGYDGRCPELDPENFPQHKILMEAVCLILVLIISIIVIIYFACCRSTDKTKKKVHTK